jgi:methyl-accepting chemotaxis protein
MKFVDLKKAVILVLGAVSVSMLTACGGGGSDSAEPATSSPATESTSGMMDSTAEGVGEMVDTAEEAVGEAVEAVEQAAETAMETAGEVGAEAMEAAEGAIEEATEAVEGLASEMPAMEGDGDQAEEAKDKAGELINQLGN